MRVHQASVLEIICSEPTAIKKGDEQASGHPQKLHLKCMSKSGAIRIIESM